MLGGTFNPPHIGHLAIAGAAREELALERVLLMPAQIAPHKLDQPDPGPRQRLRMCELAAQGDEGLEACGLELERPGPSYTVDTLSTIHASSPHTRLTFILGADTACTLGSWRDPQGILELAELAVATRGGAPRERVREALQELDAQADHGARVRFLSVPAIDVSSSQVRTAVAAGEPVEQLVGARVAAYIEREGLYRGERR